MLDPFAEINVYNNNKVQRQSSIYNDDPISQKIKNMQLLTHGKRSFKDVAENFYKQAVFMADFNDKITDDIVYIRKVAEQFMQISSRVYGIPVYDLMGINGVRIYFTWRTMYKNGRRDINFEPYLRVYVYEILQGIYENALDKLLDILKTPDLSKDFFNELLHWIMDYHVYYNESFSDFVKSNDLEKYYKKHLIFDYNFNTWIFISKYKIKNTDETEELFLHVINALKDHFSMPELLGYEKMPRTKWIPFIGTPFFQWLKQDDRKVTMPTGDEYILENGQWYADRIIISKKTPDIMAGILKAMEGKLKNNKSHEIIQKAVDQWHYNKNRIHVNINTDHLQKIRLDADDTLSKLAIDTPSDEPKPTPDRGRATEGGRPYESKPTDECRGGNLPPVIPKPTNEYDHFIKSLDDIELNALKAIKNDHLDNFLSQHGIMREIIAERINEKALEYIGDNILDSDSMILYDEYKDLV